MRLTGLLISFAAALLATPAIAHAFLEHASPAAGAELSRAPLSVVLEFSQVLEPVFSGIAVTNAAGVDVVSGPTTANERTMQVGLKPLGAGTYRVSWHAVSVDTHRTEGAFRFTVKP